MPSDLLAFRSHVGEAHLGTDLAHELQDAVAVVMARLHGLNEELLIGQHDGRCSATEEKPGICLEGSRSTPQQDDNVHLTGVNTARLLKIQLPAI